MEYLLPLVSVLLGYVIALRVPFADKTRLRLLLAFSGSFLLSLTVLHLLPEVYAGLPAHDHDHEPAHPHAHNTELHIGLFIMCGILLQIVLEFFSKGAEHGHVHGHHKPSGMPWLLFLSLCLHAFLEGFPVGHHHDLAWGIAVHHLPIAIILTLFLRNAHLRSGLILAFMLCFAAMTPLGTFVASVSPNLMQYHREITAVVIGILFHISSTIIFETSENHKFNIAKLTVIILGVALAGLV